MALEKINALYELIEKKGMDLNDDGIIIQEGEDELSEGLILVFDEIIEDYFDSILFESYDINEVYEFLEIEGYLEEE